MKVTFSDIGVSQDVTLVNVSKMSSNMQDIALLFRCFADAGIVVDMISQPASRGADIPLSFTVGDSALPQAIAALGGLKKNYPGIRTEVSPANLKVHFTSEDMRDLPGVAADVLSIFADAGIEIKMITTSEIDISLLIDRAHYDDTIRLLKDEFGAAV